MINLLLLIGVYSMLAMHLLALYYYMTIVKPKLSELQKMQEKLEQLKRVFQ